MDFEKLAMQATLDALAAFGISKEAAGPGLLGAMGKSIGAWGHGVARAASRANQTGGMAMQAARASGAGNMGAMGRGAAQAAKTFAGSQHGRQALIAGGVGAGLMGANAYANRRAQAQRQPPMMGM